MSPVDTKTALLDCAQNLIQRVGVNAMSYQDLSSAVGIRKASIHYHFPSKNDLIKALLSRCRVDYHAAYTAIADGPGSAPEKLRSVAEMFANSLREGKVCLVGMLTVDKETLPEDLQRDVQTGIDGSIEVFERIIVQGLEEQSLNPRLNAPTAARTFLGTLLGTQVISRSSPEAFEQAANQLIDTFEA